MWDGTVLHQGIDSFGPRDREGAIAPSTRPCFQGESIKFSVCIQARYAVEMKASIYPLVFDGLPYSFDPLS